MSRNTGEKYIETQRLEKLKLLGITYIPKPGDHTGTYLIIPTTYSDQEFSSIDTQVKEKVNGFCKLKDGVVWVHLRHQSARPLHFQGLMYIWWGLSLLWCVFWGEETLKQILRLIFKWSSGY